MSLSNLLTDDSNDKPRPSRPPPESPKPALHSPVKDLKPIFPNLAKSSSPTVAMKEPPAQDPPPPRAVAPAPRKASKAAANKAPALRNFAPPGKQTKVVRTTLSEKESARLAAATADIEAMDESDLDHDTAFVYEKIQYSEKRKRQANAIASAEKQSRKVRLS